MILIVKMDQKEDEQLFVCNMTWHMLFLHDRHLMQAKWNKKQEHTNGTKEVEAKKINNVPLLKSKMKLTRDGRVIQKLNWVNYCFKQTGQFAH